MNQSLRETPSILAIEPDPDRANALTRLVHHCIDARVVVSASADVAVAVMARRMPDLILMSAFTPPNDERSGMDFLRQATNVDVPVLIMWPIFEGQPAKGQSSLYRTLRRRSTTEMTQMREGLAARMRGALEFRWERETGSAQDAVCVDRAYRWTPREISWLSGIRLPSGYVRQLVNISNSGLLVECDSALMPGKSVTFELCANRTELWHPNTDLIVPARIVRSEVSKVAADQLRYLVAAQFHEALELPCNGAVEHQTSSRAHDLDAHVTAVRDDVDVSRRAAERLQDLARVLENLECAVARVGEPRSTH